MYKILASIEKYITGNSTKIIIFVSAIVVLNFLEKFPYLNTFLAFPYAWNSLLILFVFGVVLFRLDEAFSLSSSLVFLALSAVLSVFGKDTVAQAVGNIAFYLLCLGSIQTVIRLWRDKK
jgi:vacuolar-type H+-ATPase subunit I/STV1